MGADVGCVLTPLPLEKVLPVKDPPREVECPECFTHRVLSASAAYRVLSGEATGVCEDCRLVRVKSTPELKEWWLERFTVQEISVLADGLEGWL